MATSLAQSHQCRCLIESDKLCESTKTKLCLALHNLGVITPDFRMSESRCGHHRYQHSTKSLKTARQKILPSPGAVCRLAKSARGHPLALMKNARSVFRAVLIPGSSSSGKSHPERRPNPHHLSKNPSSTTQRPLQQLTLSSWNQPGYLYSADWMTHPAPASSQPSGHQFYFLFSPP
ncbi:hypothetical protein PGTUg99_000826 [Puccinia graminis f. sp. tritici]|uniref:Uncharacterized protein n=1 Tax=Puccinia graminis f. sp. tritici TaxID=56615 RepID=A0A5B0S957_PUCGR|nr:hypothetical protein PGTUg99_000826 [Puccinia graminis f. sp. tritici]